LIKKENGQTAKATAFWLRGGLHPIHRKVREGWRSRVVVAA
jgi:hypothetical protein